MGDILKEFEAIERKKDDAILSVAIELRAELVKSTPVDTGNLRGSWTALTKTDDGYRFGNSAIYADIVLTGRRIVNGKTYGSEQLPEGIAPIIQKYNEILQQKLKAI